MPLFTNMSVVLSAKQTAQLDLGSAEAIIAKTWSVALADGALAGQANRIWQDTRTIVASGTDDLDLAGSLLDALGGAFSLARVKGLVVVAKADNVNNVVVGGAATNAWASMFGAATHTQVLRPGEFFARACGPADPNGHLVTAGTGDILRIANSGGGTPVTYDIAVFGAAS